MRKLWSLLAGILSILGGCQRPSADSGSQGTSLAVAVPTADGAIEAATREARHSLDRFIRTLSTPNAGQSDFSVKVTILDGETTHYLWLQQVTYDGSNLSGILGPDAAGIKSHFPGERITLASSEITDWMFVEDEKLVGGYTMRAIRERLSGEARKQFEKSMWFKFE